MRGQGARRLRKHARWVGEEMKTQSEIEAALRFAREKRAQDEAAWKASASGSGEEIAAKFGIVAWQSRIDAYEFVLGLDGKEGEG